MYREIDRTILEMIKTGNPSALRPDIIALCAGIAPDQSPQFIEHRPAPTAIFRECFPNVLEQIKAHGGELVFGWAIWEWPGVFIEAEHHGVWLVDGTLVDVTPHECPVTQVLFLPDPSSPYDFANATRRNNIKRAIHPAPVVQEWLDVTDTIYNKLEACSVGLEYRLSPRDQRQLAELQAHSDELKLEIYSLLAHQTAVNDPCFCASGRKFKKCCARFFR